MGTFIMTYQTDIINITGHLLLTLQVTTGFLLHF